MEAFCVILAAGTVAGLMVCAGAVVGPVVFDGFIVLLGFVVLVGVDVPFICGVLVVWFSCEEDGGLVTLSSPFEMAGEAEDVVWSIGGTEVAIAEGVSV